MKRRNTKYRGNSYSASVRVSSSRSPRQNKKVDGMLSSIFKKSK